MARDFGFKSSEVVDARSVEEEARLVTVVALIAFALATVSTQFWMTPDCFWPSFLALRV
jgi:hypothetical protein